MTDACTLPTAERPLRAAEFDALLTTARSVSRPAPTRLVLRLSAPEETIRDLTVRESACGSFFTFDITPDGDLVTLAVTVPPAQVEVLDALRQRVSSSRPGTA